MLRVLKEIMIKIELVKNEDKMFQVIVKIVMIFKEYSQTTKAKEESKTIQIIKIKINGGEFWKMMQDFLDDFLGVE